MEGLHFGCAVAVLLLDRKFDFQAKYLHKNFLVQLIITTLFTFAAQHIRTTTI